jgi:hypothetical protein
MNSCSNVIPATGIFHNRYLINIAGHRNRGRCRRHRHSGIRSLIPISEHSGTGLGVPFFRYRTGSGLGIFVHFGTGLTGCRTVRNLVFKKRDTKTLYVHTTSKGLGYTLHAHTAGGERVYTLHVHTASCGRGYTLDIHRRLLIMLFLLYDAEKSCVL